MDKPLWHPSPEALSRSNTARFMAEARARFNRPLTTYAELDTWSVAQPEEFWSLLWDFSGVIAEAKGARVVADKDRMPGAQWFPDARLNIAENLLRRRDDAEALVFWGEDAVQRRMTYKELYAAVSRLRQGLEGAGVRQGDRVAGYIPNMPEAIVGMLATASLGAIWSSCSPDFGVAGALDRFSQIAPKVLLAADGYFSGGKKNDCMPRLAELEQALNTTVVVIPYTQETPDLSSLQRGVLYEAFVRPYEEKEIDFPMLPFNHPLYIVFSSGTTGAPKCIVHSAGGTLLQHLKEHLLHVDLQDGDRLFYGTTCGWMMWNWMVSALALGVTLLLYDGSPLHRRGSILFDFADAEGMTIFGTSAKYIETLMKAGLKPRETHALKTLRAMLSTGSPLVPEDFDYVYAHIKPDIRLSSISGGTDIISCFVQGSPVLPVWRGEIQCRGLGLQVEIYNEAGKRVIGEKGELICAASFPAMPIGFWNDADGSKYKAAYFEKFPGVWHHGDYAEETAHGGYIFYGRSDATLNPGGVRVGTAEIYRQVEQVPEVLESVAVSQQHRGDARIILFVKLKDKETLTPELMQRIRTQILSHTTAHHVPAKILQVSDIPRTRNGKITELAVRDTVEGRAVKNIGALQNPDILAEFKDRPELQN